MVGCVGNDIYGSELINSLRENNVSVENVNKRGTTTGIGIVQILESGDYCSTIIKGANYLISEDDITESLFEGQPLVILQSEIPAPLLSILSALPAPTIAALSLITPRHGMSPPTP